MLVLLQLVLFRLSVLLCCSCFSAGTYFGFLFCVFFFFKQKTAYEMRISDWSSDVCSSDLLRQHARRHRADMAAGLHPFDHQRIDTRTNKLFGERQRRREADDIRARSLDRLEAAFGRQTARSEEHTSDLQSLMRISYAVLCLTKQTNSTKTHSQTTTTQDI